MTFLIIVGYLAVAVAVLGLLAFIAQSIRLSLRPDYRLLKSGIKICNAPNAEARLRCKYASLIKRETMGGAKICSNHEYTGRCLSRMPMAKPKHRPQPRNPLKRPLERRKPDAKCLVSKTNLNSNAWHFCIKIGGQSLNRYDRI